MEQRVSRPGLFETIRREMRLRNYSAKTIKAYTGCLRQYVAWIAPAGGTIRNEVFSRSLTGQWTRPGYGSGRRSTH